MEPAPGNAQQSALAGVAVAAPNNMTTTKALKSDFKRRHLSLLLSKGNATLTHRTRFTFT